LGRPAGHPTDRPPASQTIERIDAPQLEHKPRRGELDDDLPF
jgi:hypothetical protein